MRICVSRCDATIFSDHAKERQEQDVEADGRLCAGCGWKKIRIRFKSIEDGKRYEQGISINSFSIWWRRIIHPILWQLIKLDRKLSQEHCEVIGDRRCSNRNVIYACTHIGGNDVQRVFEAIRSQAWLFLGDPGALYRGVLGLMIYLNGAVYLETRDKYDRKIAEARATEILKKGGSLLIFPEGAWNIEPSIPVMHLYPGTARMARKTGCDIIPIAIEVYGARYVVNIGQNLSFSGRSEDDRELTRELRDILASLKWEIWEREGTFSRQEYQFVDDEEYAQSVIHRKDWGYTLKDAYETRYHEST